MTLETRQYRRIFFNSLEKLKLWVENLITPHDTAIYLFFFFTKNIRENCWSKLNIKGKKECTFDGGSGGAENFQCIWKMVEKNIRQFEK